MVYRRERLHSLFKYQAKYALDNAGVVGRYGRYRRFLVGSLREFAFKTQSVIGAYYDRERQLLYFAFSGVYTQDEHKIADWRGKIHPKDSNSEFYERNISQKIGTGISFGFEHDKNIFVLDIKSGCIDDAFCVGFRSFIINCANKEIVKYKSNNPVGFKIEGKDKINYNNNNTNNNTNNNSDDIQATDDVKDDINSTMVKKKKMEMRFKASIENGWSFYVDNERGYMYYISQKYTMKISLKKYFQFKKWYDKYQNTLKIDFAEAVGNNNDNDNDNINDKNKKSNTSKKSKKDKKSNKTKQENDTKLNINEVVMCYIEQELLKQFSVNEYVTHQWNHFIEDRIINTGNTVNTGDSDEKKEKEKEKIGGDMSDNKLNDIFYVEESMVEVFLTNKMFKELGNGITKCKFLPNEHTMIGLTKIGQSGKKAHTLKVYHPVGYSQSKQSKQG